MRELNEAYRPRVRDHDDSDYRMPAPEQTGNDVEAVRRDARLLGLVPTKTGPVRHCNGIPSRKARGRQTKSW